MYCIRISLIAFLAVVATVVVLPVETRASSDRDVSGCAGDDEAWFDDCVEDFYDEVRGHSTWHGNYWSDSCQEEYYMREDMGGSNNSYLDISDIHFHNSHCGEVYDSYYGKDLRAIPFGSDDLVPSEARNAWGNGDLEWIGVKCCSLLNDDSDWYWAQAFHHAHLILGFATSSEGSYSFGEEWAEKMFGWSVFDGDTITSAWFEATDLTQSSDVMARVLAEVQDN